MTQMISGRIGLQETATPTLLARKIIDNASQVIVGKTAVIELAVATLIAQGHMLVEDVPGVGKTMLAKSLATSIGCSFKRIQFTPDMLPADVTGTEIFNPREGTYSAKKGPIFSNLILADEINRAPAKVQAALLEAMQERQVTIGEQTYPLEELFLVLATQNPIEQEGTYPLPEAQVDRFMLKVKVDYPNRDEELKIVDRMAGGRAVEGVRKVAGHEQILEMRGVAEQVFADNKVRDYIVDLVRATRNPISSELNGLQGLIEVGASPRASINLMKAAKAHALLQGRNYVTPHDVKTLAPDVMRHRLVLSYEAEAEGKTSDDIIRTVLETVLVP